MEFRVFGKLLSVFYLCCDVDIKVREYGRRNMNKRWVGFTVWGRL